MSMPLDPLKDAKLEEVSMKSILVTNHHLHLIGGSEMTVLDLAVEFTKRDYDVTVATFVYENPMKAQFIKNNINVIKVSENCNSLNCRHFDIMWALHNSIFEHIILTNKVTGDKIIYHTLSPYEPLEQPGSYANVISLCLANSDENRDKQIMSGIVSPENIITFPNSVMRAFFDIYDKNRRSNLNKIAVVSNHIPPEILWSIGIFNNKGIRCDLYGLGFKHLVVTPSLLSQYDAIISTGRTVQYCLSAGIPIYCYDRFGGPGWVTLLNLDKNHYHNFSGRGFAIRRDPISLFNDIMNGYDKAFLFRDELRKIAAERYSIEKNVSNVLGILASKNIVDIDQLVTVLKNSKAR